ncbi:hypothetical protein IWQ56_005416, partial [Coemansia nantahalensis]
PAPGDGCRGPGPRIRRAKGRAWPHVGGGARQEPGVCHRARAAAAPEPAARGGHLCCGCGRDVGPGLGRGVQLPAHDQHARDGRTVHCAPQRRGVPGARLAAQLQVVVPLDHRRHQPPQGLCRRRVWRCRRQGRPRPAGPQVAAGGQAERRVAHCRVLRGDARRSQDRLPL